MATYRITMFFQDNVNVTGWTENWWVNAANGPAALTAFSGVYTSRVALLMDTCQMTTARASNVDHPRDSDYLNVGIPVLGTIAHATYPAAGPWDALLVRRDVSTNDLIGHIFMHGVPAGIFTGRIWQVTVAPGITFAANLTNYQTSLVSASALLRKGPATAYTYPPCTVILGLRRTQHKVGRPFDQLRGRRAVA